MFRPRDDLDSDTLKAVLGDLNRHRPPQSASVSERTQNQDLVAVMSQRLATLERQQSVYRQEVQEKSLKIAALEEDVEAKTLALRTTTREKEILANRLAEILGFLAEYGLEYVGDKTPVTGVTPPVHSNSGESPPVIDQPSKLPFSLDRLIEKAEFLSHSLSQMTITSQERGAIIRERDTVHVCVYADGISVNSGLFRPFGWSLCDAFLSDLLDGFFPYEYKEKYPDGFLINVVDKHTENCPRHSNSKVSGTDNHGYKPLTREALLQKIPKMYVTSKGCLINPRAGVTNFLGSDGTTAEPLVAVTSASNCTNGTARTTIQVRFPNGRTVILSMFPSDSVGQLREELKTAAAPFFPLREFELCSTFPRRTFENYEETLAEANLVPTAALLVRVDKK